MEHRVFEEGPQGRSIYVDENGKLIINAEPSTSGFVYQYGPKGYPMMVDGSGHLLINGAVAPSQLNAVSGALQAEIDALKVLDWQTSVLSKSYLSPPSGGSVLGNRYIVAVGASGAWVGQDNNIVENNGKIAASGVVASGSWDVTTTNEGMAAWVEDENKVYVYNGATWVIFGAIITHNNLIGLQGGTTAEYYHLTFGEYNNLQTSSGTLAGQAWTSGTQNIPALGGTHALFAAFNGSIYTGYHNWAGGPSTSVVKITPSGDIFSSSLLPMPSGGYPWALEVVGNRLYVGAGEGAGGGYIAYTDDGQTLKGARYVHSSVTVITYLGQRDGKLLIGHANNFGGECPVFELREDSVEQTFKSKRAFNVWAAAGNWGWIYGLKTIGDKTFCTTGFGNILNVHDGVHNIGGWDADPISSGTAKTQEFIEYNGEIFVIGHNIYTYKHPAHGEFFAGRMKRCRITNGGLGTSSRAAVVYNNRLHIADTSGVIHIYDGNDWTADTTMSGVHTGNAKALVAFNDKLYMFFSDGSWWHYKDQIRRSIMNPSVPPMYSISDGLRSLINYTGIDEKNQVDTSASHSGFMDQPTYSSHYHIADNDTLTTAIGKLDAATSGIGFTRTIAAVTGWTWDAGESLYRSDINHNLANRFVVVQCYDPSTFNSVQPDHWTLTDINHVRIWASTSGSLGVNIRK